MKKISNIVYALIFASLTAFSQPPKQVSMPMMGETAPAFTAESTMGVINFPSDYTSQWKILFSHPADFTPVCTTELLELSSLQKEFKKMNTALVVISVDQLETHRQWIKSMEEINYKNIQNSEFNFPLVADVNQTASRAYGMIQSNNSNPKDVRGVFIIDPNDKIRAMYFYPMNVGRNLGEIKRLLTALQLADKKEVMTPANWVPGEDILIPYTKTQAELETLQNNNDPDLYRVAWYLNFKKLHE